MRARRLPGIVSSMTPSLPLPSDRGYAVAAAARARRRVLSRITSVSARAPRHLRSVFGPLAAEARRAALMPLGEGAERVLAELADAPLPDDAWLRAVGAFGSLHARGGATPPSHDAAKLRLVALMIFGAGAAH
jgi:hypothetical protein